MLGDADPVPQSLLLSYPEQAKTLKLLYEVSRELTSILDREELLRRVAESVKKIVDYDVFSVMLWNEQAQLLESVFAMRCNDSIAARLRLPLHHGLTGTAAGERRILRINDVTEDHVTSAVRPAWKHVPNSSCRCSCRTVSSVFSIWRARNLMRSPWNTNACYPLLAPMWPSHSRMHGSMKKPARVTAASGRSRYGTGNPAPTVADWCTGSAGSRSRRRVRARTRTGRGLLRFPALWTGPPRIYARRCFRQGTAAALYGSLAIGTVREIVVDHACEPACMLALLNQRLLSARLDSRFIAMLFAVYDASTRKLTLANAGGPYPCLSAMVRCGRSAWRACRSALFPIPNTMRPPSTWIRETSFFSLRMASWNRRIPRRKSSARNV